jgi:hypothetical protein
MISRILTKNFFEIILIKIRVKKFINTHKCEDCRRTSLILKYGPVITRRHSAAHVFTSYGFAAASKIDMRFKKTRKNCPGEKIVEIKFSSFLVQKSQAKNFGNATFLLYSNMSSFCFFALVYTLNHTFSNETTVWPSFIQN